MEYLICLWILPHYNHSLASHSKSDCVEVVLVSPRNPLNIGAVARAMANFGFSKLAVVAPYEPHWREAQSAVGAELVLQSAKKTATLSEALSDCTFVIGTGTLTYRKPEQPVVSLPEFAPILERALSQGGRAALVFGPEKHGLTREHLSHCHLFVEIPTASAQPSMNLAQAVAVCLYEVATRALPCADRPGPTTGPQKPVDKDHPPSGPAASKQLDRLEEVIHTIQTAMTEPATRVTGTKSARRRGLRTLLRRLVITEHDALYLLGFFRRIHWKLQRASSQPRRGT